MLNKIILMGRLTADPELRHTATNIPVASFTLAVERDYQRDTTDFIDIVAWRKTGEFAAKYFTKGQLVAVCGSLQARSWEDKDGNKRRSFEVVADELHFAESKKRDTYSEPEAQEFPDDDFQELSDDDVDLPF